MFRISDNGAMGVGEDGLEPSGGENAERTDIAKSLAQKYGQNGYNLHLAARKIDDLKLHSTDLKIRYNIKIDIYELDLLKTEQ